MHQEEMLKDADAALDHLYHPPHQCAGRCPLYLGRKRPRHLRLLRGGLRSQERPHQGHRTPGRSEGAHLRLAALD